MIAAAAAVVLIGAIGAALLDQKVVAGIGNEYRAEACFLAGVHPATPVSEVDTARIPERLAAIRRLDAQSRKLEAAATGPTLDALLADERAQSHRYGGRSVFGWEPAPAAVAPLGAGAAVRAGCCGSEGAEVLRGVELAAGSHIGRGLHGLFRPGTPQRSRSHRGQPSDRCTL